MVATVVFSTLSMASAIIAATLSGITAKMGFVDYYSSYSRCNYGGPYYNIQLCIVILLPES